MAKEQRKPLDGKLFKDIIKQIDDVVKNNIGLTANKLCKLAGVNPSTLDRLKDGKNVVSGQVKKLEAYIVKNKLK